MATLLRIQAPNEYAGPQQLIKSGRIVINADKNDIILAAKNTIALSSAGELHINSAGNCFINVAPGSKIIIGKPGTKERPNAQPAVLGSNMELLIEELLQLLITFKVTTPSGMGTADASMFNKVQAIKKKFLSANSKYSILSDLLNIADNKI